MITMKKRASWMTLASVALTLATFTNVDVVYAQAAGNVVTLPVPGPLKCPLNLQAKFANSLGKQNSKSANGDNSKDGENGSLNKDGSEDGPNLGDGSKAEGSAGNATSSPLPSSPAPTPQNGEASRTPIVSLPPSVRTAAPQTTNVPRLIDGLRSAIPVPVPSTTPVGSDNERRRHLQVRANEKTQDSIGGDLSTRPGLFSDVPNITVDPEDGSKAALLIEDNGDSDNFFVCDASFYKQWSKNNITCNGESIDVNLAVQASSCVIYSGTLAKLGGTEGTCLSICTFPACVNGKWDYTSVNGMSSDVYQGMSLAQFMTPDLRSRLSGKTSGRSSPLEESMIMATKQCPFQSESSFESCSCSAYSNDASNNVIKKRREDDQAKGSIPSDKTKVAGQVIAPASKGLASVTVAVTGIAAIASSVASSAAAATTQVATAGGSVAIVTIELCQFSVMINQLKLEGKSAALAEFGREMAPSTFAFLPFGKLPESVTPTGRRRLAEGLKANPEPGIATYSRTLGIREDMLFLVTLAGVALFLCGVAALFVIAYLVSGLFMSREVFMKKFFDKMIGVEVLILILSQYAIGVTATFQIHYSLSNEGTSDPKFYLALFSLLFLAFGIIVWGYIVIKKHEDDLKDMGTFSHTKKKVAMRYGCLYDEYKYEKRYFFFPKMMLALVTGVVTGWNTKEPHWQIGTILAAHVIFFFYLEIASPHFSRFVQSTTSFMTVMKIAVLVLTFFLIMPNEDSAFPSNVQNIISLVIVGLNLFVLLLLMVRSLYMMWKKYQIERQGKYEADDLTNPDEYFSEEITPTGLRKDSSMRQRPNSPYLLDNDFGKDPSPSDELYVQSRQDEGNRPLYSNSQSQQRPIHTSSVGIPQQKGPHRHFAREDVLEL